jgi:hypothetical protein
MSKDNETMRDDQQNKKDLFVTLEIILETDVEIIVLCTTKSL